MHVKESKVPSLNLRDRTTLAENFVRVFVPYIIHTFDMDSKLAERLSFNGLYYVYIKKVL